MTNVSFSIRYYDIFREDYREISVRPPAFSDVSSRKVVSFGNLTVVPAFIDAHAHPISLAVKYNWFDLFQVKRKKDLLNFIKSFADSKREPFIGYNFDESMWEDDRTYPTRKELDDVAPEIPVLLIRIDGHMGVINTMGINSLGLHRDLFSDFDLGIIVEDNLTTVISRFVNMLGIPPREEALDVFIENGIAIICDMDLAYSVPKGFLERISEKIKLFYYRTLENMERISEDTLLGAIRKYGVKGHGIKLFVDGSIGARTAYLSESYNDDPGNRGKLLLDEDTLSEIVRLADKLRLQLAIHAIGDNAIDIALRCLKNADPTLRHRIEHFEMPHRDHIEKLAKYGVVPSMQPNFIANWQGRGGLYERRLGWDRAKRMNPLKSILEKRGIIAFGSDCMPVGPLYGIYGAMSHPLDDEKLNFRESIYSYTYGAAYSIFLENKYGKMDVGYNASFVVISIDPRSISPENIRSAKVVRFFVDGKEVSARDRMV